MAKQQRLLTLSDIFTNPTTLNISIPAIREATREKSEQEVLRSGQDWGYLSGLVVGAEDPQGDYHAR